MLPRVEFADLKISIHAPARGATTLFPLLFPILINFNPRSREGSDAPYSVLFRGCDTFQSTLPRGERRQMPLFQSDAEHISIHAPARGATRALMFTLEWWLFQSTLPRGERPDVYCHILHGKIISIHAPARGATRRRKQH